ncbi:MAG TPA: response regulator transcription factor [Hyphomonadaceae bacterium]|nr:response regulator transcription factor [Hyphomonadaceae bacterium]HPI48182.1 response regulator transcription factor [Hyphomonadaceae bacterium]
MSSARLIVLIEDDAELRGALVHAFAAHAFRIEPASCAREGLQMVAAHGADLVILDVGLPDLDGREACKVLRGQGHTMPILLLTAAGSDADAILGLEAGASDYLVKPVGFAHLLARVRAQLRVFDDSRNATYQIGPYTFHQSRRLLVDDTGRKIRLTDMEARLLKRLCRAGGARVARDELMVEIWDYSAGANSHTVQTHIYRIRQKLGSDPRGASLLKTEEEGYSLQLASSYVQRPQTGVSNG